MLYHLNELKNAALWPTHLMSEVTSHLFEAPDKEHSTAYGRLIKASAELLERSTRVYVKPEFGIKEVNRSDDILHVREKAFMKKSFCTLVEFERASDKDSIEKELVDDPIVLIVAPLSGHFATLLRDTAKAMIPFHQTYITDWKDAKTISLHDGGPFTLDHYVEYLLDFIRGISGHHQGRRIHIIAVCQPSVPVLMATSLLALYEEHCQPYSMTLMGGPIDTRINPGEVNDFASSHSIEWFKNHIISKVPSYYEGVGRFVCPGFILLGGFISLNPDRHREASEKHFRHLIRGDMDEAEFHRRFYDEYMAVMDVPGDYFLDSIFHAFQAHSLPKRKMKWRDYPIKPEIIRQTGLMTVEGELDDISCPGQTLAAHKLCKNLDEKRKSAHLQKEAGHYGIFNGRRWRTFIQPKIAVFMREQEKFSF